jgi:hypothetical protein
MIGFYFNVPKDHMIMFVFVLNEKHIFLMGISLAIDSETDLCKLLCMYTDFLQQKGKIFKLKPLDRLSLYR